VSERLKASIAADFDAALAAKRGEVEPAERREAREAESAAAVREAVDAAMLSTIVGVAKPLAASYGLELRASLLEEPGRLVARLEFWRDDLTCWLELDGNLTVSPENLVREVVAREVALVLRMRHGAPSS